MKVQKFWFLRIEKSIFVFLFNWILMISIKCVFSNNNDKKTRKKKYRTKVVPKYLPLWPQQRRRGQAIQIFTIITTIIIIAIIKINKQHQLLQQHRFGMMEQNLQFSQLFLLWLTTTVIVITYFFLLHRQHQNITGPIERKC